MVTEALAMAMNCLFFMTCPSHPEPRLMARRSSMAFLATNVTEGMKDCSEHGMVSRRGRTAPVCFLLGEQIAMVDKSD